MTIDPNVSLSFSWKGPYLYKEKSVSRIDLKIGDTSDEVWALVDSSLPTTDSQQLKFTVKAKDNPRASLRLREELSCTKVAAKTLKLSLKHPDEEVHIPIRIRIGLKEGNKYIIQIINGSKGLVANVKENEVLSLSDDSSGERQ